MKILHLFSNYKFTGPADPALVLARALIDAGADVTFAAGRTPPGDRGVLELAAAREIPVVEGLYLRKHGRPLPWIHDVRELRRWLRAGRFDIVHTHLPNDHHIATVAARGTETPIVRSLYDLEAPRGRRARTALGRTAAILAPTARAAAALGHAYPDLSDRIEITPPVLDLSRFSSREDTIERAEAERAHWGAAPEDFVVGVVARMQLHRRFPELIEGFARAAREDPKLHLVILGRGTNQKIVAHEPAAQSGVGDQIHFPGYIDPARYPQVLPAFNALLFLVPGSDGTCRAMREAQACGVPVIVAARGLLPELMVPKESGVLLEEDSPTAIAEAIRDLRDHPERRNALAEGARTYAERTFDPKIAASRILDAYVRVSRATR